MHQRWMAGKRLLGEARLVGQLRAAPNPAPRAVWNACLAPHAFAEISPGRPESPSSGYTTVVPSPSCHSHKPSGGSCQSLTWGRMMVFELSAHTTSTLLLTSTRATWPTDGCWAKGTKSGGPAQAPAPQPLLYSAVTDIMPTQLVTRT